MEHKSLDQAVTEMKGLAETLLPFTYPTVSFDDEQDILMLKQRQILVDGYDLLVCYSKADYSEYLLESLQVQSTNAPFLPFTIVCKLGCAFLGDENLQFIDFFRNNRKVYCWTLKSRNGRLLPPDKRSKPGDFEGFEYTLLHPGTVDLF